MLLPTNLIIVPVPIHFMFPSMPADTRVYLVGGIRSIQTNSFTGNNTDTRVIYEIPPDKVSAVKMYYIQALREGFNMRDFPGRMQFLGLVKAQYTLEITGPKDEVAKLILETGMPVISTNDLSQIQRNGNLIKLTLTHTVNARGVMEPIPAGGPAPKSYVR